MISKEIRSLSSKALRYRLYRIMNNVPLDPFDGVQEFFEKEENFGGWENFAITWDVEFLEHPTIQKPWSIKLIDDSLVKNKRAEGGRMHGY